MPKNERRIKFTARYINRFLKKNDFVFNVCDLFCKMVKPLSVEV